MNTDRGTSSDRERRAESIIPATSTLLLAQLKDSANTQLWNDFVGRYHAVVVSFSRGLGLKEEDAVDVAQQTLLEVVRDYRAGRFDRQKGRLRSSIFGIAPHRVLDCKERLKRSHHSAADMLEGLADDASMNQEWDRAEERALFDEAMGLLARDTRLGEETMRAFRMFALEGKDVRSVSQACGISTSQVYVAKHRVMERIRETMEHLRKDPDEAA